MPPHDDFPALPDDADGMQLDEFAVPLLVLAAADLWMPEDRPPSLKLAADNHAYELFTSDSITCTHLARAATMYRRQRGVNGPARIQRRPGSGLNS